MVYIFTKRLSNGLTSHCTTISLLSGLLATLKLEKIKKLINWPKKLQNSRANLILQPLQQAIKHVNAFLSNGNRYREINTRMDDMLLQTTSPHFFNPSPILKPYTTREKSLAILFNSEQVIATLKTTTNPQFSQKVYSAFVKRNYKHISISSTHVPNMRTTAKFFTISQALYTHQIFLGQNKM